MSTPYESPERFDVYERLRSGGSVSWSAEQQAWLVVGFAECDEALRDAETFAAHDRRYVSEQRWNDLAATLGGERALALLPEPEHSRLVALIRRRLGVNMPRYADTRVRPVVEQLLDEFLDQGGGDFCEGFAHLLPAAVVASVLGLPWDDRETLLQWKAWDNRTSELVTRYDSAATDEGRLVSAAIAEAVLPVVRARREEPQDDLISELWEIVPQVLPDCTDHDIVAQCRQMFLGGARTVSYVLNSCAAILFNDRELWDRLKADPAEVDIFIEEMLRVVGVIQQRARTVTKDTVLGGVALKEGDHVYLLVAAANRDAAQFACPHALSLNPADRRRHLAFGAGPKTCAGMALARTELQQVLTKLLASIDAPRLDPDAPPPSFDATGPVASWSPVHVRFEDLRVAR